MNIVRLDENFIPSDTESAVCIGKLDGVHIGHRKLLSKLRGYLKKGYHPTVLGFEMSPADFFTGSTTGSLTTEDEKAAILEAEGVETYGVYPVNEKTMGLPPDDFVREVLVRRLHAKAVVAGEDCRTNAPGIFVAGDNRVKALRQLVTATADGAMAATEAVKYINAL